MFVQAVFTYNLGFMDVVELGNPFIQGPTNKATNVQTLDVVYLGAPFVTYWKY